MSEDNAPSAATEPIADGEPAPQPVRLRPPLLARLQRMLPGPEALDRMAVPVCAALLGGTLLWRLLLGPLGALGDLDTQESVVGLMARRLWLGNWPEIFVWGTRNMAALEPVGAAAAFSLAGESLPALRSIPFFATSLASLFTLLLVARWLGLAATVPAALVMAVAFPAPTAVMLRALGGLSFGLLLGLLATGAASNFSLERRRLSFSTGLLCGLTLFAHPALLPFVTGALIVALVELGSVLWRPSLMLVTVTHVTRLGAGLALGSLPLWLGSREALLDSLNPFKLALLGDEPSLLEASWLTDSLGGRFAPALIAVIALLAVPGIAVRVVRHGVHDPGARLGVAALATAVVSILGSLWTAPAAPEEALWRAMPLIASLPILAASAMAVVSGGRLVLLAGAVLLLHVDPGALPKPSEPGAEVPVEPVVDFLDEHAPLNCYADASIAYRVALLSSERHRCISISGPDHAPDWRAKAAAGRRAYFFTADEIARLRLFDQDMKRAQRPYVIDVAGPFFVRIVDGLPWPPAAAPVVWEHAKREGRSAIDGDVSTAVVARPATGLRIELVWPTVLTSVTYLQDITRLASAPCRVRAGVVLKDGRIEMGPVTELRQACELANRWALWPSSSLDVKVPLPQKEAVEVMLESVDQSRRSALSVSEVRVQPKEWRSRVDR